MGFLVFLFFSVLLGVSQVNFFSSWVSLELNMLMFIASMASSKQGLESISMKYFIVQSIGSSTFLGAVSLFTINSSSSFLMFAVSLSLVLKLGLAPLHNWFIGVVSKMSWEFFILASTLQKLLPLFFLSLFYFHSGFVVILSSLVSVLGSLNQVYAKKLLAYSSVFSAAWMASCESEFEALVQYLLAYLVALGIVVMVWANLSSLHLNEMTVQANKGKMAVLLMGLLSLGGSPPFLGFYAKILVIQVVLGHAQALIVMILVASSVFLLYVYVRLFYYMSTGTAMEMQVGSPDFLYSALISPSVVMLLLLPWL